MDRELGASGVRTLRRGCYPSAQSSFTQTNSQPVERDTHNKTGDVHLARKTLDRQECRFWGLLMSGMVARPPLAPAPGPHPWSHTAPTHLAAVPTVLHVDPVVLVVPEALDAQEVVILGAVTAPCQRVNEEALGHLALPGQHQDPGVHPQSMQGVGLRLLFLLHRKGG